ncbi:MAG: 50S ribosomal protein L30e [Candidatus Hecatellales archaeon]|nr:MAG: 50S ribosomal protein L30e [Candidatus Hecatellales archaeon]
MSSLAKALTIAVRTGKVTFGFKETLEALRSGKAKIVVVAKNIPKELREKLDRTAKLAGIPLLEFESSSLDLGSLCGKPYTVTALAVRDPGDSDILNLGKAERKKAKRRSK